MLATRALHRVGTARAFSTTTSTTARAAAARAALAASTRHVGARWTAAAAPRARWRDAMKARVKATAFQAVVNEGPREGKVSEAAEGKDGGTEDNGWDDDDDDDDDDEYQ